MDTLILNLHHDRIRHLHADAADRRLAATLRRRRPPASPAHTPADDRPAPAPRSRPCAG